MVGKVVKSLAVVTIVASFGVWIWALVIGPTLEPADLLDDLTWAEQAEAVCAQARADVDSLPLASEAGSVGERSDHIGAANQRYRDMLIDLEQLQASSARDAEMVTEWRADWELFLSDRDRYAEAILDDPAAPFTVTNTGGGERLYRRISRFAVTNFMLSCVAPEDV